MEQKRGPDRRLVRRHHFDQIYSVTWNDHLTQYLARVLFAGLAFVYFNFGETAARTVEYLLFMNAAIPVHFVIATALVLHARMHPILPIRARLGMCVDLVLVTIGGLAAANLGSPIFLLYIVIILGNGMRYGLRLFGEGVIGSLVGGFIVVSMRLNDYLDISFEGVFYVLFLAITILYSYILMKSVERARRDLEHASTNDSLTGLLNRLGLQQSAKRMFSEHGGHQVAVMFIDVDGLKVINDQFGHAVGDRVLQQVAIHIHECIREKDAAARFGGDEFVLLLPDTDLDQATAVAERLQRATAATRWDGDTPLSMTIGLGESPTHGTDLESVLKSVDLAMYRGKLSAARGSIQRATTQAVA